MTGFDPTSVLGGLTAFQRNSVEHVIDRFYGADPVDRFLVADQTGLGKTMVARGVIARAIETLQDREEIDRIDIVYICSNQDLARQNLRKLNVTDGRAVGVASRLTMLAEHVRRFTPISTEGARSVNLVSFTPGTSFSRGSATGTAEERAMLLLMLEGALDLGSPKSRRRTAALNMFRSGVESADNFERYLGDLQGRLQGEIDPVIRGAFHAAIQKPADGGSLLERTRERHEAYIGKQHVPGTHDLISDLRGALARASIARLTPDLVILDEFQRFRDLLSDGTEAGELAHHLFDYRDEDTAVRAKVLLLSATPFKPFTYAEESALGDNHHEDFMKVVDFLTAGKPSASARIREALGAYRRDLVDGRSPRESRAAARDALLKVMVRTERPDRSAENPNVPWPVAPPSASDLRGYVALRELAAAVGGQLSIDYWKSAPYFVNFMGGYQLATKVREALSDDARRGDTLRALRGTQTLTYQAVEGLQPIEWGSARLRALAERTVDQGWWKLLWMPPSLPYLEPGGVYAEPWVQDVTKMLIFSSWNATPTAISALLSHEARRLAAGGTHREGEPVRSRLRYAVRDGKPGAMSALMLFWPMPDLAEAADPRGFARGGSAIAPDRVHAGALEAVRQAARSTNKSGAPATAWFIALNAEGSFPEGLDQPQLVEALSGAGDPEEEGESSPARGTEMLAAHVELAMLARGAEQDRVVSESVLDDVASLAAHSPANISYRALRALVAEGAPISRADRWRSAARLASALRSLFARPEAMQLLDQLYPREDAYWRAVLAYCRDGNLQAVLDEYLHHLAGGQGGKAQTPERLAELVSLVVEAISLKGSRYQWFDPQAPDEKRSLPVRFALRYGSRKEQDETARTPEVRQAFNSPFWPMVLSSTSVGQEGIDFHWWCSALLHWNTPPNPVDYEQREGRVDRYDGLVVRRNIAAEHGAAILASEAPDPWDAAYAMAATAHPELGSFSPHWVYPGSARVERHTAPFALSTEQQKLADVRRDVARYRLTFGQPRQEDLLEVLAERFPDLSAEQAEELRIDLSAPEFPRKPSEAPVPESVDVDRMLS